MTCQWEIIWWPDFVRGRCRPNFFFLRSVGLCSLINFLYHFLLRFWGCHSSLQYVFCSDCAHVLGEQVWLIEYDFLFSNIMIISLFNHTHLWRHGSKSKEGNNKETKRKHVIHFFVKFPYPLRFLKCQNCWQN